MSAEETDGVQEPTDELDRISELACDEAMFGVPQGLLRELDEAGEVTSRLRGQLALVASGLALRGVTSQEALPSSVRSRLQAQAFGYFERQGMAAAPTATTTGANVVELAPATTAPPRFVRRWVQVLAAAACVLGLTATARWQLQRGPTAPSVAAGPAPLMPDPLRAAGLGASAELRSVESDRTLVFTWSDSSARPLPESTFLWIRAEMGGVSEWRRVAVVDPRPNGTARLEFDPGEVERVVGFAVSVPRAENPNMPDLGRVQLASGERN